MSNILYASFASNMLKERFMVYIKGGVYNGKTYRGCRDKTEPIAYGYTYVPFRLYFANESPKWDNKGVAFLETNNEPDPFYFALVRLWKVTEQQFEDIYEQETKTWYDKIITLGTKENMPIKSFTSSRAFAPNKPSDKYIKVILSGLMETTGWNYDKCLDYLTKFIE